mmetsp:Transcript_32995/g.29886  ORF Transcript_32995/g.29886 Transcript_32995/m.29886 type:complete len:177 (+) Transcript_32995:1182-1712(+)
MRCDTNISAVFCDATFNGLQQGASVLLAIYNPAAERSQSVRTKVPNGNLKVQNWNGETIDADVMCSNSTDITDCDLYFEAYFQPYSLNYFKLMPSDTSIEVGKTPFDRDLEFSFIEDQKLTVKNFNEFTLYDGEESLPFKLSYVSYQSQVAEGCDAGSGAYIFRPIYDYTWPFSDI